METTSPYPSQSQVLTKNPSEQSVPSIDKNTPIKFEEVSQEYNQSEKEKRGKFIFILAAVYSVLILFATWGFFVFWLNNPQQ